MTDEYYPRLEIIFGGHDSFRDPVVVDAEEFIAVKGFKAKGKRLTTYTVETINELEPTRHKTTKKMTPGKSRKIWTRTVIKQKTTYSTK